MDSLFPKAVRNRLMGQHNDTTNKNGFKIEAAPKVQLKKMMADKSQQGPMVGRPGSMRSGLSSSEPIADLFPNATVLFADISGFSAWSSERESSQIFTLLETLYGGIDNIARKLGVFKVETVVRPKFCAAVHFQMN